MYIHIRRGRRPEPHAPGELRRRAEGLSIHKVAPAANGLPNEKSLHAAVRQRPEGDLAAAAEKIRRQKARNDAAVAGKAAVPDAVGRRPVDRAVAPAKQVEVEKHIVNPRTDDGKRDDPEHRVDDIILAQAVFRRLLHAEIESQQHARGNDDAVPVDAVADVQCLGRHGELPVAEKAGKADGRVGKAHGIVILLSWVR